MLAARVGAEILDAKEKYGGLRVAYALPDSDEDIAGLNEFIEAVDQAEADSRHMCEMCGRRGVMFIKGGWLKVLCKDDALNLDYRDKA